ncbi:chemotaxis-specific protein-glutamate methyltransferase CheB [Marinobacter sp. SS21]|uniref:chemotaxis-specific protein-glutamate methyltransferase CheB n=1 Tax=Marinobacter sp. SS21 TaxID=2979460 RepID=UPI00232DD9BA|nr:chemotaxis-specific protein-glutamate methyltransferase CheB [Marinobacter sp. SS21]MDC0663419.1 chemotaxis-specific protein-glutamate methyltransferase CheB [Marinobacter sp. SS21]
MKVLIVEDSIVVRQLLRYILEQGGMEVIGEATDGEEALSLIQQQRPDVITMDVHLPKMDGFECTRRIMESDPIPIVVVTGSYNISDSAFALRLLDAGAVTVVEKPMGMVDSNFEKDAANLIKTVRNVAELKLVRRVERFSSAPSPEPERNWAPKLVAIGASTGGPAALKAMLAALEPSCPWPILVVQHITPGFLPGFCEWLNGDSNLNVQIAQNGTRANAGNVYVAPDGVDMAIDDGLHIRLVQQKGVGNLCPSAASLFESVGRNLGGQALAILLSGMGNDGVSEMLELKKLGALTLAQDAESAVVNGMPGEAMKAHAASRSLPPEAIAQVLNQLAHAPSGQAAGHCSD